MTDREYVEKGSYTHPQADGYIALKQYIFIRRDGKRCLLLRFANEFSRTVHGFEVIVTQLSSDGRVIGRSRVPYQNISVASGNTYSPDSGVVVRENCADFRISLVYFVSGDYKYVIKRGHAVAHYDPRGYEVPKTNPARSTQIAVKSVHRNGGIFTLIAVVSTVIIVGLCLVAALSGSGGKKTTAYNGGDVSVCDTAILY